MTAFSEWQPVIFFRSESPFESFGWIEQAWDWLISLLAVISDSFRMIRHLVRQQRSSCTSPSVNLPKHSYSMKAEQACLLQERPRDQKASVGYLIEANPQLPADFNGLQLHLMQTWRRTLLNELQWKRSSLFSLVGPSASFHGSSYQMQNSLVRSDF